MKIKLIVVGKTKQDFVADGCVVYSRRIANYLSFEEVTVPVLKNTKNLNASEFREREGSQILKMIQPQDFTILLDEKGKSLTSEAFAGYLQQRMLTGIKTLNFVIGGAYGFSNEVYDAANAKISLSAMTFSHQLIRVIFMEQLYRAMTILNNEPYHNA
jgi:23S rRNA (pseudouridine1915-N3)-methyltransferase